MVFKHAEKIVDYATFVDEVEKIRLFYIIEKEKLKVNFSYKDDFKKNKNTFVLYLDNYKSLMIEVLKKTLNIFRSFLDKNNHMIIISGSFARNSHRDFSDLDVSIVLGKKKTKEYIVFEELFYYALASILNMSRDRVHGVFINMVDKYESNQYDKDYALLWNNCKKSLEYQARENTGADLALSLDTERLYSIIMKDVTKSLNKCIYTEYSYVYEVIENTLQYDLVKDIVDIEKSALGNNEFNLSDNLRDDICGKVTSRDLKKMIKGGFFGEFNNFCSYVRHYAVTNFGYDKLLNINEILRGKLFKKILGKKQSALYDIYYEYVWFLTRLEICIKMINSELSSHNYTFIDCDKLKELYNVVYEDKENIFEKLFNLQKKAKLIYTDFLSQIN